MEDCKCEGFYKKEYFKSLDTIQKLREELHSVNSTKEETQGEKS